METDDLAAWYRADQQAARETYAAADSATLVALLEALDSEVETSRTRPASMDGSSPPEWAYPPAGNRPSASNNRAANRVLDASSRTS
jgi:hypothetical protein